MTVSPRVTTSLASTNLADLLERILDKGIVIAGDIRINLVDVELLTIQLRLVICSVDKAKEMGMDWWVNNPALCSKKGGEPAAPEALSKLENRLDRLEEVLAQGKGEAVSP